MSDELHGVSLEAWNDEVIDEPNTDPIHCEICGGLISETNSYESGIGWHSACESKAIKKHGLKVCAIHNLPIIEWGDGGWNCVNCQMIAIGNY